MVDWLLQVQYQTWKNSYCLITDACMCADTCTLCTCSNDVFQINWLIHWLIDWMINWLLQVRCQMLNSMQIRNECTDTCADTQVLYLPKRHISIWLINWLNDSLISPGPASDVEQQLLHECTDTYVCTDTHKSYACSIDVFQIFVLYSTQMPTYAMRYWKVLLKFPK